MKMSYLLFLLVLTIVTSCGGKNSTSEGSASNTDATTVDIQSPSSRCNVKFNKADHVAEIAIKSNRARVECGLTEAEVLKLL
jgi:hypothetical protein